MLNNFCFHGYAKMSLFMAENVNDFFWTLSCDWTNPRAGIPQLKTVEICSDPICLLMDMKCNLFLCSSLLGHSTVDDEVESTQ